MSNEKTVVITGASGAIGRDLVAAFLKENYRVVGTSRNASRSFSLTPNLIIVNGDITERDTAIRTVDAAIRNFGSIDVLVETAGIYYPRPFIGFTHEDLNALVSINLLGFVNITQLTVKQMLKQKSGSVVSITASLADNPIAGVNASVPMLTKGGLNAIIRSLAIEYAKENIRFNAVAPGPVDTHLKEGLMKELLKKQQPMGSMVAIRDIVSAVFYLVSARQVTGEILHVDGGAHTGKW